MNSPTVVRLKIVLEEVQPTVLRRIEVPLSIRLDRLHLAIQAAMGWTNSHLYEFKAGNLEWGFVDPEDYASRLDATQEQLDELLSYSPKLTYLYDLGDGWEHTITIDALVDEAAGCSYPLLIEAEGRCPPEDVGGPWGYAQFLKAIENPSHRSHVQYRKWFRGDFDPNAVDFSALVRDVEGLANRWSR
jgi:hypothetical protein